MVLYIFHLHTRVFTCYSKEYGNEIRVDSKMLYKFCATIFHQREWISWITCISLSCSYAHLVPISLFFLSTGEDFAVVQQEIIMMKDCKHSNIVAYFGSYLRYSNDHFPDHTFTVLRSLLYLPLLSLSPLLLCQFLFLSKAVELTLCSLGWVSQLHCRNSHSGCSTSVSANCTTCASLQGLNLTIF